MERNNWFIIIIGIIFVVLIYQSANISNQAITPIKNEWTVTLQDNGIYYLGEPLQVGTTQFVCTASNEKVVSKQSCFSTNVFYRGVTTSFVGGDNKFLNQFISMTYSPEAQVRVKSLDTPEREWVFDNKKHVLHFTLENPSFLNVSVLSADKQMSKDMTAKIELQVNNQLASGLPGGFSLVYRPSIINTEITEEIPASFGMGKNNIIIPLNTNFSGFTTVTIKPYVTINSDSGNFRLYSESLQYTYGIGINFSEHTNIPEPTSPEGTRQWLTILGVLAVIAIIVWPRKGVD